MTSSWLYWTLFKNVFCRQNFGVGIRVVENKDFEFEFEFKNFKIEKNKTK